MHRHFMLEALEQAWLGRGQCAPNPSVGAIAVRHNEILAKAYHPGSGKPHAEQLILQQLTGNLQDVTLYVTLEPCNHWGKTPPCINGIIERSIGKVVYAYADPNPLVAQNDTPALLKEKGIDLIHFPLSEVDSFYKSYHRWTLTQIPWVTTKLAQTLDGKIAGEEGMPLTLSNQACANFTHKQRQFADVILTTANTIIRDDPQLNVRLADVAQKKPVAIIDSQLRLLENAKILKTAACCHIYHDARYSVKKPHLNAEYHAVPAEEEGLDLKFIIKHLGHLGYHDLWVEAGGRLFSALHQKELVDTTFLYLVPKVLGEKACNAYHGESIFNRKHQVSWNAKDDNMILRLDWLEKTCLLD